ncbi:unnamed protein product [Adineta ricciae]|uniref:ADP ribosyltransferase domain-containing protein n=1 Tax=Adineta ricciae TaxID=249248 RepID=A0A815ZFH3_ADIRI|nr:unnamed protein product [Adineta ricciae]
MNAATQLSSDFTLPYVETVNEKPKGVKTSRMFQNFLVIWLNSNNSEPNADFVEQLRRIVNHIDIFDDVDACIDCLTEIKHEKVFMIVSGTIAQYIIPLIYDIPQLHSIYIFLNNIIVAEHWLKVKGTFTEIGSICDSLKQAIQQYEENLMSLSFLTLDNVSDSDQNHVDQTFMYSQILKEIILGINYDVDFAIKHLTEFLREKEEDSSAGSENYVKLEREYKLKPPIWWYTSQSYIYLMVNRALRTQEIDEILLMGFFIHDLHENIEQLYVKQNISDLLESISVYRGQGLSKEDFERLVKTKGGLISFNNFLSTSIDRQVAYMLAESIRDSTDLVAVIFEMTIDTSISSFPFARLSGVTQFDQEQEFLFSMHTVFRIGDIDSVKGDDRFWQVKLSLTKDNDQQLCDVTKKIREEIEPDSSGQYQLGKLLLRLGEYGKAKQLYEAMLNLVSDDNAKVHIYLGLGSIYDNEGNYKDALVSYERCMEISQRLHTKNDSNLINLYNSMGLLHLNMGDYSTPLHLYQTALNIAEKQSNPNDFTVATIYNNMALVYMYTDSYSDALEYYKKSLDIYQKILPSYHPNLALAYNNFGLTLHKMGKYTKALEIYEKALKICVRILPSNHSIFISLYNNLGGVCENLGEYFKALEYHRKSLELCQTVFTSNHPLVALSYNNIGLVYTLMGECSKALWHYEEGLKIRQNIYPVNHYDVAISYDHMGSTYRLMADYSQAISFHERALEIYHTLTSSHDGFLASCYVNMGNVYLSTEEYLKAISFYEKALNIRQNMLSTDHSDLGISYNNIGAAYFGIKDYSKAISFYEKALEIYHRILPSDHPNFIQCYKNFSAACFEKEEFSKALLYCEKLLDIYRKIRPSNHVELLYTHSNIATLCENLHDYPKALLHRQKEFEIGQILFPENHLALSTILIDIGLLYECMNEHSNALSYFQRAVDLAQQTLPSDHPELQVFRANAERSRNVVNRMLESNENNSCSTVDNETL